MRGIAEVRRFNRFVGQRIGALDGRFLARDRPMAESRLLWEVGEEGAEVAALRVRLGLDSGHLSRLLRSLEGDGLVEVTTSAADRRARVARLTAAGRRERSVLDVRSDDLARSILDPLPVRLREELLGAMATVERLLTGSLVELRTVDPAAPDARACVRAYFAEIERRAGTALGPQTLESAKPDELRPPAGAFIVAYLREDPVGCGGLKHHADGGAEIKRMWVSESARGLGLGRRLLAELERLAAEGGATTVRLDSNRHLVEAIAMYRAAGYEEVPAFNAEPFAHHWFAKAVPRPRSPVG